MTTSLSSALPGLAAARATPEHPAVNGKKHDTGFGKMLRGDASPARPQRQPATETVSREPRWGKLATGLAGHDNKAGPALADAEKIASTKMPAEQIGKDGAKARSRLDDLPERPPEDDADPDKTAADADAVPLQDHLPMLIAFHDLRHFSASANAAVHDAAAGGESVSAPAADEQAPLPEAYRSKPAATGAAIEAVAKREPMAEQASVVGGPLMSLESPPPKAAGSASGTPERDDVLPPKPLADLPAADAPGPRPKHEATAPKSVEDVRSSTRPEPGKQSQSTARIDVVHEQSFPAPPPNVISQAARDVVGAIAADGGPQKAPSASSVATRQTSPVAVPTHVLKIELHPAELGMVTASLRLSGEQLSIELKPTTHDAFRRLSGDSEAIVKSLRGLGFEVDKVTILQPSVAVPTTARADTAASLPSPSGRDQSSFQPGSPGGGNAGAGGHQPGQQSSGNRNDGAQDYGRGNSSSRDRAGGDIFI